MEQEVIKKDRKSLKSFFLETYITPYRISNCILNLKKNYSNNYDKLLRLTKYLPENCTFSERIYHILYDIYEKPICKNCGNILKYKGITIGYGSFCCSGCVSKYNGTKEKKKKTYLKHYGVDNPNKSKIVRNKIKDTCLEKYGCEYTFQAEEIKQSIQKTNIEKYGTKSPCKLKEVKDKSKQTMFERYGFEHALQVKDFKNKFYNTCENRFGTKIAIKSKQVKEKLKQIYIDKYGVENPSQLKEVKDKKKKTYLERYGVDNPSKYPEFIKKVKNTWFEKTKTKYEKFFLDNDIQILGLCKDSNNKSYIFKCLRQECGIEFEAPLYFVIARKSKSCPNCFPICKSIGEEEVRDFLRTILPSGYKITKDRNIIQPLELDIYIPDKHMAIEYNGLYWHSDIVNNDSNYHLNKTLKCEEKGINLIHIFEDEWILKKDIVKSRLKQILNINTDIKRIHARQCEIKEIDAKSKDEFLDQYHIQGKDISIIKLGAFYKNELVSLMTFSKPSISKGQKTKKDGVWELNRFCSNSNYHIPGIASKLLSYFKYNYNWIRIYSYADRRWSTGDLYYKLGFELDHITKPNYWYVKGFERIHRFVLRKRDNEPKNIPEWFLRAEQGYIRIWDCGNYMFCIQNNLMGE